MESMSMNLMTCRNLPIIIHHTVEKLGLLLKEKEFEVVFESAKERILFTSCTHKLFTSFCRSSIISNQFFPKSGHSSNTRFV